MVERVSRLGVPHGAARRITIISAVATLLGACSFGMRRPDPSWNAKQKPDCAESYYPVVIDTYMATSLWSVGLLGLVPNQKMLSGEVAGAMLATAVIYAASAKSGALTYGECRKATALWRTNEAIRERDNGERRAEVTERAEVALPYFCVSSQSRPALELCTRERSSCEHARDIFGLRSGRGCRTQVAAWCFDASGAARCFATARACEIQQSSADGTSECSERH